MFNRIATLQVIGKEFRDFRMSFEIVKSLVGFPNLASIKVYNLSESDRNRIETEKEKVRLFAGYEDTEVVLIFDGDIVNVTHLKQGTDWITEIFCGDAVKAFEDATINKTLGPGATSEQIYDELTEQLEGVAKGVTEGLKDCLSGKRSLLRALQLSGNVKDWLDKLAEDCGFEYSVNDGVIETIPKGFPLSDEPPVVINQASGMIGSPERTEIGVNVINLLLPALKLGRTVRVEAVSTKINIGNLFFRKIPPVRNQGVYRINKMTHVGDTRENPWETRIEGAIFN